MPPLPPWHCRGNFQKILCVSDADEEMIALLAEIYDKEKTISNGLSLEERKFVNQANPATLSEAPYQPSAKKSRKHEGFIMIAELRQRMTKFSWHRKQFHQHPWTKQDLYNFRLPDMR